MRKYKEKKIFFFDGQVFQGNAWDRGMGKYSLNFLASLHNQKQFMQNQRIIIFTKHKKLSDEVSDIIKKSCPDLEFKFLDLKIPKKITNKNIHRTIDANQKILDKYIQSVTKETSYFFILSLFLEKFYPAFPLFAKKILLFFDLIPYQFFREYSASLGPNYICRFKVFFQADMILTISETVSDDIIVYTGISKDKIKNIAGGPIDRKFLKANKPKLQIPKLFILMPSGDDIRKNNYRAVQGFEEFRTSNKMKDFMLIITSFFSDESKKKLKGISTNLIFTGNTSEAELKWLYENMEALLFVSEYEGLGLPVLEAVEYNKPIVCSNISTFNEMSPNAFYYSDQYNPASIAKALGEAIKRNNFENKQKEYFDIIQRFNWEQTAKDTISAINKYETDEKMKISKLKLAIFAPNPSGYSAIGKVAMLMHQSLSQYFDIDYFLEDSLFVNNCYRLNLLEHGASTSKSFKFNAIDYARYDAVVYHIGNGEYHLNSIKNALHLPGYLIIHDTNLSEAFEKILTKNNDMNQSRLEEERNIERLLNIKDSKYLTTLINSSLGTICHSEYAKNAINKILKVNQEVIKLNLPVGTPKQKKKRNNQHFSVGFAGIIHKDKGINLIKEIIYSSDLQNVDVHIFGIPLAEPQEIEQLELLPQVTLEKNLTDFKFETRLSEMDVIICYRPTYKGETSLTVLEALRHGVTPIVRNVGWFSELPDNIVEKVENEEEVISSIKKLVNNPKMLKTKQKEGIDYIEKHNNYSEYAKGIFQLIQKTLSQKNTLNQKISSALHQKMTKKEIIKTLLAKD